ncbi:hypothetical protein JCM18237_13180 [Halorubrum luteum]
MATVGGLERRDGRNLIVMAAIVFVIMALFADGSLGVRLLSGAIGSVIASVVFVISTILINRYKPDHW